MNSSDSHESVKGGGSAGRSATGYKAVPRGSTTRAAEGYLLCNERQVIAVRQHPAVLIGPIFVVLVGLAIAGLLSEWVAHGNGTVILVIWVLWGLLLLRLLWKVVDWSLCYFVVTSQRLLLVTGFLRRRVGMMPLAKVTDMTFNRSRVGQILGHGEFVVESAGLDEALHNIGYLSYPEQLYLEVCALIFNDGELRGMGGT
jgi:membrane protein YdbS with pleckstrin-like domain